MKKFFRFFAIAALACGMMTACGGDDPEGEGEGGDNSKASVKVTVDGTSWEAAQFQSYDAYATQLGFQQHFILKEKDNEDYMVYGYIPATTGAWGYDDNNYVYLGYCLNDANAEGWVDVDGEYGDPGTEYAHWQLEDASGNITAIDLNAHTTTATSDNKLYDLIEYMDNDADVFMNVKVELNNAKWDVLN